MVRCWRLLARDAVSCFQTCPGNLRWKAYLVLARLSNSLGCYATSLKVRVAPTPHMQMIVRAYHLVAEKSSHLVLAEYAKRRSLPVDIQRLITDSEVPSHG